MIMRTEEYVTRNMTEPVKTRKKGSGGARPGAGRKPQNKVMLHTSIDADYLVRLRSKADEESCTVGAWLERHVTL